MPPKDELVYVAHMLDVARQVQSKVAGLDRAGFDADENLQLAVTHLIQIIGEAARLVSDGYRDQHAEIPWHQIIGMRHRIVHDYLNIDFDIVWEVAHREIGGLIAQLEDLAEDGQAEP